jgi:flagellar L-ring protein precursor FlgH
MESMTPVQAEEPQNPADNPGSLYSEAGADYLFSDNRAHRVGDIVLVSIVEKATAKNKAETTSDRESTTDISVSNFFQKDTFVPLPFAGSLGLKGNVGSTPIINSGTTTKFDSTGETKRESEVTATVAARVVRILPGGLMQIEGAREVRVNDETQIMVVRGIIRPRDISSDNSVLSTHIADSRIEYYGKGVLADKQRPGWLSRVLENVWPF